MAEQLTPINPLANNTVNTLIALANAIVNTIATTAVTANGAANGALTNGNGYVSGIFGSSVLVAGALRGGNVQSSANLIVQSNTWINSAGLSIGNTTANATVNSLNITIPTVTTTNAQVVHFNQAYLAWANANITETDLTTTGLAAVNLDSWALASYRSAEYILQVTDNAANNHQVSKLLITHDGVNALWDEYGLVKSNTQIATFAGVTNATTLSLQVTPASANMTIRSIRSTLNF